METQKYSENLKNLGIDPVITDRLLFAATWFLARTPYYGIKKDPDTHVWFIPMTEIENRSLDLYYTFDEHHVYLLRLEDSPDSFNNDDLEDEIDEVPF